MSVVCRAVEIRAMGRRGLLAAALGLATLTGCQTTGKSPNVSSDTTDPLTTGSVDPKATTIANAQKWARYWEKHPNDTKAAISYAAHLQALNQHDQALGVLRKTAISNPLDSEVLAAYGKQLARMGQLAEANKVLFKATTSGTPTWQLHSLYGTVLDRLGKQKEARAQYHAALRLSPNNADVMNNLAMSHAIHGDARKAEEMLMKAIAASGGTDDTQLQQNLALVLGLQGEFERARKVLAKVLSPPQVEANMATIKKMISQRNTWQQIETATPDGEG